MRINEKGQCPACSIKPLTYKRRRMLFCHRCNREYDMDSGEQHENFAWKRDGEDFSRVRPESGSLL